MRHVGRHELVETVDALGLLLIGHLFMLTIKYASTPISVIFLTKTNISISYPYPLCLP